MYQWRNCSQIKGPFLDWSLIPILAGFFWQICCKTVLRVSPWLTVAPRVVSACKIYWPHYQSWLAYAWPWKTSIIPFVDGRSQIFFVGNNFHAQPKSRYLFNNSCSLELSTRLVPLPSVSTDCIVYPFVSSPCTSRPTITMAFVNSIVVTPRAPVARVTPLVSFFWATNCNASSGTDFAPDHDCLHAIC